MKSLSDLHSCKKSEGKIVVISVDMGITRCGYCNEAVDYMSHFKEEHKDIIKTIEAIQNEKNT